MTSTSDSYDVVVIGAGLNGITAATVLARSGRKVLILERSSVVGGLAAGSEFHPEYHSPGLLHDTTGLSPEVVENLGLTQHGLRRASRPPSIFASDGDGNGLLIHHNPVDAAGEWKKNGTDDAKNYARFRAFIDRTRPFVRSLLTDLPPDWLADDMRDWRAMLSSGLAFRRLGKADMMELLRLGPMSVADWLDEQFESPMLKSAMAVPALHGYWGGPMSPGTTGTLLRYESLAGGAVIGGPQAIVDALLSAAKAAGVEIHTSTPVAAIDVQQGAVQGVCCDDGHKIRSRLVLSSCDPRRTLLDLLDVRELTPPAEQGIRAYRMRGLTAKVHLALNKPLQFRAQPDLDLEYARTAQSLTHLERGFDEVKYGRFSKTPALDLYVPSVSNSESAPDGHSSVSILLHGVPHDLDGGWTDAAREELGDVVVLALSAHVEKLDEAIVAREVLTPVDIGERYGLTGGHAFHGEHGLDQLLVRPTLQCARYATPINGLYLCGGGTHPGGGLTCAPGFIAANTILKGQRK